MNHGNSNVYRPTSSTFTVTHFADTFILLTFCSVTQNFTHCFATSFQLFFLELASITVFFQESFIFNQFLLWCLLQFHALHQSVQDFAEFIYLFFVIVATKNVWYCCGFFQNLRWHLRSFLSAFFLAENYLNWWDCNWVFHSDVCR